MGQQIIHGLTNVEELFAGKKFFLVRGKSYDELEIKEFFNKYPHVEFMDFTSNPLYEQICMGIKLFNIENCDMIVAVGGGSAIDVAKCIKLYCKMNHSVNYLKQTVFDTGIPLLAVPTTAGTGSESTQHAVIYYKGEKQSISHYSIVPEYAVLEPSVLKTLPIYQKKCTMLDALCQAIESWWSVNSTDMSKHYAVQAIDGIKSNWEEYIFENTADSAANIMEAANLAGRAINITATTAAHAMSYKITSMYHFPHGHAVAVCMLAVWEYMLEHTDECIDPRGSNYLKRIFCEMDEKIDLAYFKEMLQRLELVYPKSENKETDLDFLVASVNPLRLKNNPIALSTEVLKKMYGRIVASTKN